MPGRRPWLRPIIGLGVAAAFITLALRRLEWEAVRAAWRTASPGALILALALLAAGFWVRVVRWWWMLRALEPGLPLRSCARPFFASLALNNTLPLRAGDVVRAFGFREALRSSPTRVVGTLLIERVLDAAVLLGFFFVGLLGVARGAVPAPFVRTGAVLFVGCVLGVLTLLVAPNAARRVVGWLLTRGPLAASALARRMDTVSGQLLDTLALVQSPARAGQLTALSVLAWGLEGGMYAAVAWALGTPVAPAGPWFALTTGTLATLLPSSPGYVGTFDYFAMLGLTAYGAPREAAAAHALLVHLLLWLPATLVGGVLLVAGGRRARARTDGSIPTASRACPALPRPTSPPHSEHRSATRLSPLRGGSTAAPLSR
jgi:uncharacterized protein (TIRG00374 family)